MDQLLHAGARWASENATLLPWLALALQLPLLLWGVRRANDGIPAQRRPVEAPALEPSSREVEAPALEPSSREVDAPVSPVAAEAEQEPEPTIAIAPEPEPTIAIAPEPEPAPPPRVSLRERLTRTRETLVGRLGGLLGGSQVDEALLEELEAVLFTADLGVKTAQDLLDEVRREASGEPPEKVREVLRRAMGAKLRAVQAEQVGLALSGAPHVVLVLGVNGSGKTTTIGKLAARYREAGHSVILGAADTFRAAAREQLQAWGERVGCEVIVGADGGDSAAVAFDTVAAAKARGVDVALIDTAGRLQTKAPLMEELSKIARVISKELPGAPHETLLVLDANTGQNAISQAREFAQATPVSGLVLTKLDGSAKGGVIVGLADEFQIPVRFVGVGEGVEDLRDFSAEEFVEALFG